MDAMRELVLAYEELDKKTSRLFRQWMSTVDKKARLREKMVKLATQMANDPGDEHQEPDLGGEGLKCEAKVFTIPREVQDEFGPEAKKFRERASAMMKKFCDIQERHRPTEFTLYDDAGNVVERSFIAGEETPAHLAARSIANEVAKPADEPKRINFREFL